MKVLEVIAVFVGIYFRENEKLTVTSYNFAAN